MSTPKQDGDRGWGLLPEPHWQGYTDFDHPWQEEQWDGPPDPRRGGVFGPLDAFLMRFGRSPAELEDMSESRKRAEARRMRAFMNMTPEERRERLRELEMTGITKPLSEQMGLDEEDGEESKVDQQYWRRFRRRAWGKGDLALNKQQMEGRLEKDRNDFKGLQDKRETNFRNRQQSRFDSFNKREQRRKDAWNQLHPGDPISAHFHAEGEARLAKTESVFSSVGHDTLFKKVIGFDADQMVAERNAAAKWALDKYGLDFCKAREQGDKLIIEGLGVMEPFVIHENIDMVQKSGKGDAIVYAGGQKVTITASEVTFGGDHTKEKGRNGDILLYGHYFIDRDDSPVSACLFESRKVASPNAKGDVTVRLDLLDHYVVESKAAARGEGKMTISHEDGKVCVANTMEF